MKILATTILLLLSVATYGQADTTRKSTVYVLRSTGFTGSARQFKIFVDGNLVCKMKNDSYLILEIVPGRHAFAVQMDGQTLRESTEKVDINVESGKDYYLSCVLKTDAMWSTAQMDELTENSGKAKIMKLKKMSCNE